MSSHIVEQFELSDAIDFVGRTRLFQSNCCWQLFCSHIDSCQKLEQCPPLSQSTHFFFDENNLPIKSTYYDNIYWKNLEQLTVHKTSPRSLKSIIQFYKCSDRSISEIEPNAHQLIHDMINSMDEWRRAWNLLIKFVERSAESIIQFSNTLIHYSGFIGELMTYWLFCYWLSKLIAGNTIQFAFLF